MKYTIKMYDFINKEKHEEEVLITGLPANFNKIAEDIAEDFSKRYPNSTISVQWKSFATNETNSINLQAFNQKIDEDKIETGEITFDEYCKKWYGSTFSTEFLKGILINKS